MRATTKTPLQLVKLVRDPADVHAGFEHVWHVAEDTAERESAAVAAGAADVSLAVGAAFMLGLSLGTHFAAAQPGRVLELIAMLHAEQVCGYADAERQIADDVASIVAGAPAGAKAKLS